jgi:hypothetical protein
VGHDDTVRVAILGLLKAAAAATDRRR